MDPSDGCDAKFVVQELLVVPLLLFQRVGCAWSRAGNQVPEISPGLKDRGRNRIEIRKTNLTIIVLGLPC